LIGYVTPLLLAISELDIMIFLSLIVVLALVHWFNFAHVLHFDGWFKLLVKRLQLIPGLSAVPALPLVLALVIPIFILVVIFLAVHELTNSVGWMFFVYVPVLLYSLGRGNFVAEVNEYLALSQRGDSVAASKFIDELRGNSEADPHNADIGDWPALHTQALKVISYRGFERTFAVLFWFFIAGPFGALLYRLSVIYREISAPDSEDARLAAKWLWLLEMPAVRLMGVTWAMVGNFDACPLRQSLLDIQSSSMHILNNCLRGALGASTDCKKEASNPTVDTAPADSAEATPDAAVSESVSEGESVVVNEDANVGEKSAEPFAEDLDVIEDLTGVVITTHSEPAYSFALVKSSLPLYTRSLLFWVCAIAFSTLVV
jgi:AmpE protein